MRPSTAAEVAGARRRRPAAVKAKRGSGELGIEREGGERGEGSGSVGRTRARNQVDLVQPIEPGPKCNYKFYRRSN